MLTDLSLLRDFLAFARSTHVTRAAEELHMSPSTLSTRLRQLERQVGMLLIEPAGRTVRLTDAGEALVEVGRNLLHEVELAEASLVSSNEALVGRVRLGCDEWFAITLSELIPAYSKQFPHVALTVQIGTGTRTHKLLQESEIDLAIVALERLDRSYHHVSLVGTEVRAFGTMFAGREGTTIDLKSLSDQTLLLHPSELSLHRQSIDTAFLRAGIEPEILLESTSKLVLLKWAAEGLGVALIPGAPPFPDQGVPSVTVTVDGEQLTRETVLAWRRGSLSPAVETMKRLILSRLGDGRASSGPIAA